MCRPRITIDASVLAAAIWIQTCFETHIGAAIASNDRFCPVAKILCLSPGRLLGATINVDKIIVSQIDVQLFEPICRAPGSAAPAHGRVALRRLLDDRPEFLSGRHVLSSPEHIEMSSQILINSIFLGPTLQRAISFGVME